MSLVANGPHTVTVYLEEVTFDSEGNKVKRPSAVPVEITGCLVQPVASARGAFGALRVAGGQDVLAAFRVLYDPTPYPHAPLDWWSRVEWVDDNGDLRKFSVLGGPLDRRFSQATKHVSCTLQEMR